MGTSRGSDRRAHWAILILTDVQFWIPVAVLVVGLFVLRWVS